MMAPGDDSLAPKLLGIQGLPADAGQYIDNALRNDQPLQETVAAFEKLMQQAVIARHAKLGELAAALGIGRSTLDEKRKKYGL